MGIMPQSSQANEAVPTSPTQLVNQAQRLANNGNLAGNSVSVNGTVLPIPWMQIDQKIAISDYALSDHFGATFLNTNDPRHQPVLWFPQPGQAAMNLRAWHDSGHRFLDITDIAVQHNWILDPVDNTLQVTLPPSQIQTVRYGTHSWGERLVLETTSPVLTRLTEGVGEFSLTLPAITDIQTVNALPTQWSETGIKSLSFDLQPTQTTLNIKTTPDIRPILSTVDDPPRIIVDIRNDFLQPLNILWATGLRWRQQYLPVAGKQFPVYWLQLAPRQSSMNLRPIWTDPITATGISPLVSMAQRWQAAAAINGGFFNRDNQYPLGAVRFNSTWISGPILNRGGIGWDAEGNVVMRRLFLKQTLTAASGESFPLQTINSGYVQAGIGLYTPAWGLEYRPIVDSEIVITVINEVIVNQQQATPDHAISVPADGYLLALRSFDTAARVLRPGTKIEIQSELLPSELEAFPNIVGGGPLLLQNSSLVLNAEVEQFSRAFATQAAPRSAIGLNATGELLLVAVHSSPGGSGPTLAELAQIMAQLGSTAALNLDGGSSASLYLGGRLLNRNPRTAARVNNGIGLFFE